MTRWLPQLFVVATAVAATAVAATAVTATSGCGHASKHDTADPDFASGRGAGAGAGGMGTGAGGAGAGGMGGATTADDPTCPLVIPGTTVSAEDTPQGPSLVFVTTGDAAAVRTRAAALAAMHNKHDGPDSAFGMMFSAKATATTSDVEGGARVTFAGDPEVADALRMHAKMLAGKTSCAMEM